MIVPKKKKKKKKKNTVCTNIVIYDVVSPPLLDIKVCFRLLTPTLVTLYFFIAGTYSLNIIILNTFAYPNAIKIIIIIF